MYKRAEGEPSETQTARLISASKRIASQLSGERLDSADKNIVRNANSGFTIPVYSSPWQKSGKQRQTSDIK